MRKKIIILLFVSFFISIYKFSYSQDLTPEQIYEKVNDCIVVILSYDFNGKLLKQGSGVVLNDKGWIVTNYHVFAECEKMEVKHNDKIIKYTDIIGVDVEKDILILKIEDNTFPSIQLGSSDNLKVGQRIYAIGSPLGLENSISEGIISGLRNVYEKNRNYIQITASISSGSSGGAVVNSKGELIGISTLTLKEGQNLNFAIPINDIMQVSLGSFNDEKSIEALNNFFKGCNANESGKYNEAINYLTKSLEVFQDEESVYYNRGNAYTNVKKFSNAISDYTKAIEINPSYAEAYNNRGCTYSYLHDYTKAISDCSKAIEINSNYAEAFYNRGLNYCILKKYSEAILDFTKAVDINPNYVKAYFSRGNAYFEGFKEFQKAIFDYTNVIEISPNYLEAYYYRGYAYYMLGKINKSCEDWQKAYSLGLTEVKKLLNEYCK